MRGLLVAFLVVGAVRATARLEAVEIEMRRATVIVEDGSLTESQAARFARLVDQGIADVESLLRRAAGPPLRQGRVIFRVRDGLALSTTRGRTVSLMANRVRSDSAPYLHETVHALLPGPHRSVWLAEGFASYVESYVSENMGGYDARVFTRTGSRGVHDEAARWLARGPGREVLPYLGRPGQPPDMVSDRRRVAAPFYVLSHSFTKFLVDGAGLAAVVGAASSRDPEGELARRTGREVSSWKADWVAAITRRGRIVGERRGPAAGRPVRGRARP